MTPDSVGYSHGSARRATVPAPGRMTTNRQENTMSEKNEKAKIDVTEEQARKAEQQDEQDVEFQAEELEERIAPAKVFNY
jgi:hypothetical protein